MAARKTESAEHRSFRRYYADMLDSIDDPTSLAARLYSVELLSRETRKNISDLTRRQQKVLELLDAVETKIGQDTDNFYFFLEALEHISMLDLCGKLRSKCAQLKSDAPHLVSSLPPTASLPTQQTSDSMPQSSIISSTRYNKTAPSVWNQPLSELHLATIAAHIDDWRAISPFLELTAADESAILGEAPHSVPTQKVAMLRRWKQRRGVKATYEQVCHVFGQCERADLVEIVQQLVAGSSEMREPHIIVPDSLLKELSSLKVSYARFLRRYKKEIQNSPEAQEEFVETLPRILHRGLGSERNFQSYFDTLVEEEVSLFNVTYLEQICEIFPEDVCATTKQLVVKYKEQYQRFMGGTTLSQFRKLFPVSAVSSKLSTGKISITLKLENYWGDNTLDDLKKLVGLVGSHLHIEKISVGSVIVNLLCSITVAKELKGAIVQATKSLQTLGVLQIFIGVELVLGFPQSYKGASESSDISHVGASYPSFTLGIDRLVELKDTLKRVNDWQSLGLQLGLLYHTLEQIETDNHGIVEQCKTKMIAAWLKRQDNVLEVGVPSWSVLKAALREIGEGEVADQIVT